MEAVFQEMVLTSCANQLCIVQLCMSITAMRLLVRQLLCTRPAGGATHCDDQSVWC